MKRSGAFVIAFLMVGVLGLVQGCGSNPCQACDDVTIAATRDACSGEPDCQFCTCFGQDQIVNSTGDGCEDPPPPDPMYSEPACEGSLADTAQAALDANTCGDGASELIALVCP